MQLLIIRGWPLLVVVIEASWFYLGHDISEPYQLVHRSHDNWQRWQWALEQPN